MSNLMTAQEPQNPTNNGQYGNKRKATMYVNAWKSRGGEKNAKLASAALFADDAAHAPYIKALAAAEANTANPMAVQAICADLFGGATALYFTVTTVGATKQAFAGTSEEALLAMATAVPAAPAEGQLFEG